jgi:hypothetical protein
MVGDKVVMMAWECVLSDYQVLDGIRRRLSGSDEGSLLSLPRFAVNA